MKLWHDDIRRPPDDSWTWVRSNNEARAVLSASQFLDITEISLDHDLGLDNHDPDAPDAIYLKGSAEDNGVKLVEWMVENRFVPAKVTIHSWNPVGADTMRKIFQRGGYHCQYVPFTVPR